MFPLPFLIFCSGGNRRVLRSKQRTRFYKDAVWSLNWLSRTGAWGLPPGNPADQSGHQVAARLRRLVVTTPTSVGALVPDVALTELLRGRGVYEVGPSGVDLAPYLSNLVSLPASLVNLHNSLTCCRQRFAFFWMANVSFCEGLREVTNALVEDGGGRQT